jgi:undecaprenyl diphosphate synthase
MNNNLPTHIGIIMDGNGRWAKNRGLVRSLGHKKGAENLEKLLEHIFNLGIKYVSVYAFSTENFKRDKEEVDYLMNLFIRGIKSYSEELHKEGVKVIFSGIRKSPLPENVIKSMNDMEQKTKNNTKGIFNICINYDGQQEIIDATNRLIEDTKSGKINEPITRELFNSYLYQDLPPVDFVIRTSGENRLSGFMLWQSSYAEFYFPKTYFPDFKEKDFDEALEVYNNRERRFGKEEASDEE